MTIRNCFDARYRAIFCAAAGIGTLLAFLQADRALPVAAPRPLVFHMSYRLPPEERAPVEVDADATHTAPADLGALRAAVLGADTGTIPASAESTSSTAGSTPNPAPDWFVWGQLGAERARTLLVSPDPLPASALGLYGSHAGAGTTVVLVNHTDQKLRTRAKLWLPRGVYRIERLTFALPSAAPGSVSSAPPSLADTGPGARLERLEGSDRGSPGAVWKEFTLEPGQVCLYRATDVAMAARGAWYQTQDRLHAMAESTPGPARRLRRMLDEADSCLGGVSAGHGRHNGVSGRLESIHRLLLVTFQAQALHRNYLARKTVNTGPGEEVQNALDHLSMALSETSAVLLGLVPEITIEPESAAQAGASGGEPGKTASAVAEPGEPHRVLVTVAMQNTGDHSVSLVKIGLDESALPPGVASEPTDPEVFGTLEPGQTVRATFHLRYPVTVSVPGDHCIGDVSYFAAGTPAHLRPHPW